jgi:hypothetical protein
VLWDPATILMRSQKVYPLLAALMLLTVLSVLMNREARADSQKQARQTPVTSDSLVIQGTVIGIQGAVVTVKSPNAYPGGPGVHAQFVTAGPTFRVDISHARILLPDGKQADTEPLAVGDRVLMVLRGMDSEANVPLSKLGNVDRTYVASTIERIVYSDKIVTH